MPPETSTLSPPVQGTRAARFPVGSQRINASTKRPLAETRSMRRLFWAACGGLAILIAVNSWGQQPDSVFGSLLIVTAALLPSFLWVSGKVRGLPIFPVSALPCIWAFGLPLISDHPIVDLFPGRNQMAAAWSVTAFLLCGTLAWFLVGRRPVRTPKICRMMIESQSVSILLTTLGGCVVWTVCATAGWIRLSSGVASVATAALLAAEALACFVLSYQLGSGTLTGAAKTTFVSLFGALLFVDLPGLLLINSMSLCATALLAYVTASKRLPWRVGLVALCAYGLLHFGKSEMREKYWHDDEEQTPVGPFQYPGFMADWIETSWRVATRGDTSDERGESLLERASLMHWLLYIQANTPAAIPYMNGVTYAVIPRLFVPRIIDPDKPRSHEATYLIAIHYGFQTREDTEMTTVAFGMLTEAYANFGFLGMGVLGAVLGAFYAAVARWAQRMPVLSFRALFAILVASYSFQAEFTSTVYAAALFQSTVVLCLVSAVFMRSQPVSASRSVLLS